MKTLFVLALLFINIFSCKMTEKDIAGSYTFVTNPKTILKINPDRTFEFSVNNRNPYLHPFDHPDQYFFDTKGTWKFIAKKRLSLSSQTDTLIYPLASIQTYPAKDPKWSNFVFFDRYGDTIKILYVQYADSSISMAMHRSMDYKMEDLSKRDTFEFHFYGYPPYKLITGMKTNQDYKITLKPSFQPNYFKGTAFRIKRMQLIEVKKRAKFSKLSPPSNKKAL
jgi:hypothetical protein